MLNSLNRTALITTTALTMALVPLFATALPTGGSVSAGSASISTSGSSTIIRQSTTDAVINWTGFNTTKGQSVSFEDQQGAASITLNRVSGPATTFNGALSSNGNVWVINPNGVLIGSTGTVNTEGFLATTSNITDSNFMAGKYNFTPTSGVTSNTASSVPTVSNAGTITITEDGLAALVAPHVANSGKINMTGNVINAKVGTIALASGDTFTVDLAGDGLINLAASKSVTSQSLSNTGTLNTAAGGTVAINAAQAANVVDNVINLDGIVEATNVTGSGDTINYGAAYTPASKGSSFTLTATGNINVTKGATIGQTGNANPVNVSLDSTDTGSVNLNSASINTGGGNLSISARDNQDDQNIQSIALNGTSIITNGGNITINANGEFSGQNGSISNAGNVSLEGASDSLTITNNPYGIYLSDFSITSNKGEITLIGDAPLNPSASSFGVSINNSSFIKAENGDVSIYGAMGPTTHGASTGVSIYDSYVEASGGLVGIQGGPIGYSTDRSYVNGGSADGVVITQSVIGGPDATIVGIFGTGGNAWGYASEGIVINNNLVMASGANRQSGIDIFGTGGVGTSTIGVDATGGWADFELANTSGGGLISITGYGGVSSKGGADAGVAFAAGNNIPSDIFTDNLNIQGYGGVGTNSVNGAGIYLSGTNIEAVNAKVTGQGGEGTGTQNFGIELAGANTLRDTGTLYFSGTGMGSAADIQADESATPGLTNSVVFSGTYLSFYGTRNNLNLKDLVIVLAK